MTSLVSTLPQQQQHQHQQWDQVHVILPTSYDRFATRSSASDCVPTQTRRPVSSTATSSTRNKRRVHFNHEQDEIFEIITKEEYTDEEYHACWADWDEKGKMFQKFNKAVKRMASGKEPKKNDTYRGLENFSDKNNSSSDKIIHHCIDAVMDEQERQWEDPDVFDWDRFREVSLEVTRESAILAFRMAAFDACQAREAYIAMSKGALLEENNNNADDDDSSESENGDESSLETSSSEPAEIPKSLKDAADCRRCWHPRRLKAYMSAPAL